MEENGLSAEGQARRRFLKQAGTVAWATPFIVTMMSRAAHAQDLCGTIGPGDTECTVTQACGSPQQCLPSPNPLNLGDCVCATLPDPTP